MPHDDEHDPLAALDFAAKPGSGNLAESDPLGFSAPADDAPTDDSGEDSADAMDAYAPTKPDDTEAGLEALDSQTGAFDASLEEGVAMFTVVNPPQTVSVSALLDGATERVVLSPKVTGMSEAELAEEIVVIARLAQQKGLAGQQRYWLEESPLSETMREVEPAGADAVRDFMNAIGLTTPEQAAEARAEVFATRYGTGK